MIQTLRIPPHSKDAERGVLGSILLDPHNSIPKCIRCGLHKGSFYDRRHQVLFEQMYAMGESSKAMDAITIAEWLNNNGALERVGGYDYLVHLQDSTLVSGHVEHYCKIIMEKHVARSIIEKASEAIDRSYCLDEPDDIISALTSSLVGEIKSEIKASTTEDIIASYYAAANGNTRCIPTPFDGLTMRTGGPMLGMETLLTGRSKSGKSMLKSYWQTYLGLKGIPTLDCPYEDGEIVAKSRCASIGSYNAGDLIRGGKYILYNGEWRWEKTMPEAIEVAERKLKELDKLPMHWDEERVTISKLKSKLARYVDEYGIKAVFLDGAKDILRPSGSYNDTGCEEEISHGISDAARSLDIAIISVYHLTKLQNDELITSRNIRGSGNIVSNSRLVYALQGSKVGDSLLSYSDNRPLEYNSDGYCTTRTLECIDNNHGALGKTWLSTDLDLCSFSAMKIN